MYSCDFYVALYRLQGNNPSGVNPAYLRAGARREASARYPRRDGTYSQ